MELGAGVGLCSAVAIRAGACTRLCTTDVAGPVLELASQNLQVAASAAESAIRVKTTVSASQCCALTVCLPASAAASARARSVPWSVALLDWGDEAQIKRILGASGSRFDTVVAAEVIYPDIDAPTLRKLFKTVDMTLVHGGAFICAFVERSAPFVMRMLEVASSEGWELALIPSAGFLPRSQSETSISDGGETTGARLHATEGAKLLKFTRRAAAAGCCNHAVGELGCAIFPGLKARLQRMARAAQEAEEWVAPFAAEDELECDGSESEGSVFS